MRLYPHNSDSEDCSEQENFLRESNTAHFLPLLHSERRRGGSSSARAFTLIEMLVVLAIIGLLAALTLPHIRGHSESVAIDAAARQLMDDIAFARLRAISQRGTVAIVFIAPRVFGFFPDNTPGSYTPVERALVNRLHGGVYTHYALYEYRKAGEQPGSFDSHGYITEWKSLPEKTFIEPEILAIPQTVTDGPYLAGSKFPFPLSTSVTVQDWLPYIAFDQEGRCIQIKKDETGSGQPGRDVEIRLARGSILYTRRTLADVTYNNSILPANFDVQQIPPGNASNTVIHIDAITGRAKRIEPQLP